MDWNSLKVFLAVAQSGSLVAASNSLGMSHSTVYRRLNHFEQEVGRLFERINGNCRLTEMGEQMLQHAQRINHSFDDIERHIAGKDKQCRGTVRITAPSSFSYHDLPAHFSALNKLYPDIQLELLVTNLELNMTNRQADIALRVTSTPPDHLVGREIRRIKWGVYAHPDYLSEHGRPDKPQDFSHHRLIGAAGFLRDHPTFSWLDKNHGAKIDSRTDDLVAMLWLAQSSHGLAVLPDELARPEIERLFTFEPVKANTLWILTHPDLRKVERIKIVMKYLATALADV